MPSALLHSARSSHLLGGGNNAEPYSLMEVTMSTTSTIDARQATINLIQSFLQSELEQVTKDKGWIQDNVTDTDKREKRLSYQSWREERLTLLLALTATL